MEWKKLDWRFNYNIIEEIKKRGALISDGEKIIAAGQVENLDGKKTTVILGYSFPYDKLDNLVYIILDEIEIPIIKTK